MASESITCPYCWEVIDVVLDLSVAEQAYVEDCSVCCRPISIRYRTDEHGGASVEAAAESEA